VASWSALPVPGQPATCESQYSQALRARDGRHAQINGLTRHALIRLPVIVCASTPLRGRDTRPQQGAATSKEAFPGWRSLDLGYRNRCPSWCRSGSNDSAASRLLRLSAAAACLPSGGASRGWSSPGRGSAVVSASSPSSVRMWQACRRTLRASQVAGALAVLVVLYLRVVDVVGARALPASYTAQRSTGGLAGTARPGKRLPSEEWTVMSSPANQTALRRRRTGPLRPASRSQPARREPGPVQPGASTLAPVRCRAAGSRRPYGDLADRH
jgi:hypothetical protein